MARHNLKLAASFAAILTIGSFQAHGATDNGFGDDMSKTGYFTVASYKAFGSDTVNDDLVANAKMADPASLNAIVPASGDENKSKRTPVGK